MHSIDANDWWMVYITKKMCGVVLLDFSAVFDVIDHNLLLEKLELCGFKPSAPAPMKSYL